MEPKLVNAVMQWAYFSCVLASIVLARSLNENSILLFGPPAECVYKLYENSCHIHILSICMHTSENKVFLFLFLFL